MNCVTSYAGLISALPRVLRSALFKEEMGRAAKGDGSPEDSTARRRVRRRVLPRSAGNQTYGSEAARPGDSDHRTGTEYAEAVHQWCSGVAGPARFLQNSTEQA